MNMGKGCYVLSVGGTGKKQERKKMNHLIINRKIDTNTPI